MRYTILLGAILLFTACENNSTTEDVSNIDSTTADSLRQAEEDEMSKEIIEGAFDALNR